MTTVTVLGLGPMGRALAGALHGYLQPISGRSSGAESHDLDGEGHLDLAGVGVQQAR